MLYMSSQFDTAYGTEDVTHETLLWQKSKDPTYYAQQGIRNGKKTTTRNVRNFGKHSELLRITDDPLAYVNEEIRKMNEEYRVGRVEYEFKADFNEKVRLRTVSVSWRRTSVDGR